MKNNLMLEMEVEKHFCVELERIGGRQRKMQYIGRRGASDRLAGFRGDLWLVEFKRPKGGVFSIHQVKDEQFWLECGVIKVHLYTIEQVDEWIAFLWSVN